MFFFLSVSRFDIDPALLLQLHQSNHHGNRSIYLIKQIHPRKTLSFHRIGVGCELDIIGGLQLRQFRRQVEFFSVNSVSPAPCTTNSTSTCSRPTS